MICYQFLQLVPYILLFLSAIIVLLRFYCRLTLGFHSHGHSMKGKTVLITGATSGIGKATALDLATRNARILLACRNLKKAEEVKSEIITVTGNYNVEVKHLDLESFDSVRKCAEDILKTEKKLDVLINNAGVFDFRLAKTKDGCEKVMQANHLGHFLFTLLLLDLLGKSKPSRIINVSSTTYRLAVLDLNDMKGNKHGFFLRNIGNLYNRSKLANILFTVDLARRLEGTGITVNCCHPGVTKTDLLQSFHHPFFSIYRFFLYCIGKSTEEGAQTSIYLAVDPQLQNVTGKFFYDCAERRLYGKARDKTLARKLFEESEKIVGKTFEI